MCQFSTVSSAANQFYRFCLGKLVNFASCKAAFTAIPSFIALNDPLLAIVHHLKPSDDCDYAWKSGPTSRI